MGRIAEFLQFLRKTSNGIKHSLIKTDLGGNETRNVLFVGAPGDDSVPLSTDKMIVISLVGSGKSVCVGVYDTLSDQTAVAGERRLYARDAAGAEVCKVHLQNDGTITASNGSGTISLGSDGVADVNGVTIDPTGAVAVPLSLTVNGIEVSGHTHISAVAGNPSGPMI